MVRGGARGTRLRLALRGFCFVFDRLDRFLAPPLRTRGDTVDEIFVEEKSDLEHNTVS